MSKYYIYIIYYNTQDHTGHEEMYMATYDLEKAKEIVRNDRKGDFDHGYQIKKYLMDSKFDDWENEEIKVED